MAKHGKRYREVAAKVTPGHRYPYPEAVGLAVETASTKFDETVETAVALGVNPRHADQMVRGAVVLPHGLGKTVRVLVFAKGEKEKEALDAGADFAGAEDLIAKIQGGWLDFDKAVATPDIMGQVGKIGKILGPRGLMPNVKVGTVTFDVAKAVNELKGGKVEFRVDRAGVVHAPVGKVSFGAEKLLQNLAALMDTLMRLKPATSKGTYMKGIHLSTTMGPGIPVDPADVKNLIRLL
ncbi:MAG: 50S ribosomal protein L1 [Syntrophales bacterium]|nr:50S ribosomal protein L1 [Syntrophales bacterium]MDD5640928.1 50S ribosomal protein L1 [Syntrophales bacterium]